MPFTLALTHHPTPSLRLHASGVPFWRQLQALADRALTPLTQLWMGLFTDARTQLAADVTLEPALNDSILFAGEHVVLAVWEQAVEQPARQLLPLLIQETVTEAAALPLPTVSASVAATLTFQPGLPEVQQAIDALVGTQIRDISATTLRTVRQVLRAGWNADQSVQTIARDLRGVLGLTPRQAATMARLRTRLAEAGQTARQVQGAVDTATQIALRQRALAISRTESMASVNMGSYLSLVQSSRQGYADEEHIRRDWETAGGNVCAECAEIPGMNPDGVGLYQPFATPWGPLLYPPGHPSCRCVSTSRIVTTIF